MLMIDRRVGEYLTIEHKGQTLLVQVFRLIERDGKPELRLGFEGPMDFRIIRADAKNKER